MKNVSKKIILCATLAMSICHVTPTYSDYGHIGRGLANLAVFTVVGLPTLMGGSFSLAGLASYAYLGSQLQKVNRVSRELPSEFENLDNQPQVEQMENQIGRLEQDVQSLGYKDNFGTIKNNLTDLKQPELIIPVIRAERVRVLKLNVNALKAKCTADTVNISNSRPVSLAFAAVCGACAAVGAYFWHSASV